ncbi:MAG: hypothetical protein HZB59_10020 [Ignavibacteriales bacterium]|nr:hypothetical protein [Ignavibacteriales bacterium]
MRRGIRDYGLTRERGEKRRSVNTDRNNESISGRKSMSSRKIKVSQRTIDRQHLRNGSHAERSDKPSSSYQPNRRMSRSSSSGSIRSNSNGGRLDRSFQNHGRSYVPTTRPSRSSFSAPRSSSGFRGGGFGGGSRSSGGGSRGVGSRGGRR